MSREDRDAFVNWLRESPVHVSEMLRMEQLHAVLAEFRDWEQISSEGAEKADDSVVPFERRTTDLPARVSDTKVSPRPAGGRKRYLWIGAAVAAAAVVVIWVSTLSQVDLIQTGRGERRGVILADGSLIRIDPESRLRIRFEPHTRNVRLEQGRAAFRVAKDPARPFLVNAGSTVVRAVGTEFGVERARDGIVVTVASGKVAVFPVEKGSPGDRSGALTMHSGGVVRDLSRHDRSGIAQSDGSSRQDHAAQAAAYSEVLLTAGQQVTVPPSGAAEAVKLVDRHSALAWADGRLVFDNSSVADVVEQFNRYNFVQLHVGDRQLATRLVSGVFDANEPDSFISVIQTVASVRVERRGQDVTLFSAPSPTQSH